MDQYFQLDHREGLDGKKLLSSIEKFGKGLPEQDVLCVTVLLPESKELFFKVPARATAAEVEAAVEAAQAGVKAQPGELIARVKEPAKEVEQQEKLEKVVQELSQQLEQNVDDEAAVVPVEESFGTPPQEEAAAQQEPEKFEQAAEGEAEVQNVVESGNEEVAQAQE